jgi:hypothetical protein
VERSKAEDSLVAEEKGTFMDRCDYCLGTFGCSETEDEAHMASHREKIRWYVETVDWNRSSAGFYETLGYITKNGICLSMSIGAQI